LELNSDNILYESLYFYPKGQRAILFERMYGKKITFGESLRGNKKNIEEGLLDNQLFLSKSSNYKLGLVNEVYRFFVNTLVPYNTFFLDERIEKKESKEDKLQAQIESPIWKKNLLELLKAADTGITDIVFDKEAKIFYTKHEFQTINSKNKSSSFLNLRSESLGTQRLIAISGIFFDSLIEGGITIIDELDRSLHPLLAKMLIKIFHSKKNNPNNAQLIFTTHDSSLMNGELFRRDQMFITEKDENGQTSIKSLASIKGVRKDIPFEKWYLNGSFGGIPVIYEPEFEFNAD
jgi:AAA15 family ATPase/GTPase